MMLVNFKEFQQGSIKLIDSPFLDRFNLNASYLKSLTTENLLRNFYLQAGLWSYSGSASTSFDSDDEEKGPETWHWGWESPTCELRGHFLGHWLSASAYVYGQTGDQELRAKTLFIVQELARCQQANGGEWVAAIPESYMERILEGRQVWAPHYTIHKIFMGLHDVYRMMKIDEALHISDRFSKWFYNWTTFFTREKLDMILDYETGGMLEAWVDLYDFTGKPEHLELIKRYDRPRFFDALLEDKDVLTNKHANTQVAEILGAARAWEVTGEIRWRNIVEAFWEEAVVKRGTYCTGGVSCGEVWTPPQNLTARLGLAQEHCVIYNMMRLSQFLYRWTGDVKYADFWEKNLYNGIMSQQNKKTGMVSYFLDMGPGSKKNWGSSTKHFWCCHGTLVQAQASYDQCIFQRQVNGITISQFIPSRTSFKYGETNVKLELRNSTQDGAGPIRTFHKSGLEQIQFVHVPQIPSDRPDRYLHVIHIECDTQVEFEMKIRIPWWVKGEPTVKINGEKVEYMIESSFILLKEIWKHDQVTLEFPKQLSASLLPGSQNMVALMDGPLVLAGLVEEEREIVGDYKKPDTFLTSHNERHHSFWNDGTYKTKNQSVNFKFIPLADVTDERYTLYFPIQKS